MNHYLNVLRKYVVFEGRSERAEYWYYVLFNIIFFIILRIIENVIGDEKNILSIFYGLVTFLPGIAVIVRRLHDINKKSSMVFLVFIPIIGTIWILILMCKDGTKGENKYGADPKNRDQSTNVLQNNSAIENKEKQNYVPWIIIGLSILISLYFFINKGTVNQIETIEDIFWKTQKLQLNNKAINLNNQQNIWQTFTSTTDKFSILMPSIPTFNSINTKDKSKVLTQTMNNYISVKNGSIFSVSRFVFDKKINIDNKNVDSKLNELLNKYLNDSGDVLVSSSFNYYNNYRTLDFVSQNNDFGFNARLIWVDQTPYFLVNSYPKKDFSPTNYLNFINSFQLK